MSVFISQMLSTHPHMVDFADPGPNLDLLFDRDLEHTFH